MSQLLSSLISEGCPGYGYPAYGQTVYVSVNLSLGHQPSLRGVAHPWLANKLYWQGYFTLLGGEIKVVLTDPEVPEHDKDFKVGLAEISLWMTEERYHEKMFINNNWVISPVPSTPISCGPFYGTTTASSVNGCTISCTAPTQPKLSITEIPYEKTQISKEEQSLYTDTHTVKVEIPEDAPICKSNPYIRFLNGLLIKVTKGNRILDYTDTTGLGHFIIHDLEMEVMFKLSKTKTVTNKFNFKGTMIPDLYIRR